MALALYTQVCLFLPNTLYSSSAKLLDSSTHIISYFTPLSFPAAWSFLEKTSPSWPLGNSVHLFIHSSNDYLKKYYVPGSVSDSENTAVSKSISCPPRYRKLQIFPSSVKPSPGCTPIVGPFPPLTSFTGGVALITMSCNYCPPGLNWESLRQGPCLLCQSVISGLSYVFYKHL